MVLRRSKRLRGPIRIDHALFPHITELILAHAPWSALLAFRATSHYFHDYITPLLVHHLTLYPLSEEDHDHLLVRSPFGGHIPGFEGIDLTSDEKDQDSIKSFTQHTRVLDLEGYVHPQHLGILAQMFPNLETYRITTDPMTGGFSPFFIPCKTLVLFTGHLGMNPLNPFQAQLDYNAASLRKIPDGVTKVVINMRGGNWYTPANYTLPATVQEVIVIFPSYQLGSQAGSFVNKVDRNMLAASTATFLGWSNAWYTLVGLDEIKLLVRSFLAISDTEFRKKYKLAAFLTRDLYAIATGVQNISLESVERFYQDPVIPLLGQNDGDDEFAHTTNSPTTWEHLTTTTTTFLRPPLKTTTPCWIFGEATLRAKTEVRWKETSQIRMPREGFHLGVGQGPRCSYAQVAQSKVACYIQGRGIRKMT